MLPRPVRHSICFAALALLAACYASHEAGGGAGARDGGASRHDARADAPHDAARLSDAAACADLPGGAECGCVATYRRCDTCELPCPDGQLCWRRLGVCRPPDAFTPEGAPLHDICNFSSGSYGTTHCPAGGPCALTADVSMRGYGDGVCVTSALCAAAPTADPPLPRPIVCVDSTGLPWRPPPPADACPDPRFCGGPCGACPRDGLGAQSCAGVSAERPFGVCSISAAACAGEPIVVTPRDPWPPGFDCLVLEPRADEDVGWFVEPNHCRAYAERYDGVRCRPGTVAR